MILLKRDGFRIRGMKGKRIGGVRIRGEMDREVLFL